jgi:hypothetical protein
MRNNLEVRFVQCVCVKERIKMEGALPAGQ